MNKAKRGYQEKKQLLKKHEQTEKALTNQAKQLMQVANVVTKDVDKLHETISRRKNYDQINREACKSLDDNLNANFHVMSSNNNAYKSALCDQTSSLMGKMGMEKMSFRVFFSFSKRNFFISCPVLGSNTKQSKEFCANMISNLNALIDAERQAKQVIEGFLASSLTEVQEIFQKHHAEKEQILRAAEQQRDALKKQYLELQASVDASYDQFEKSHLELQNLVRIS